MVRPLKLVIQLLASLVSLALSPAALAAMHLGPVLTYEQFHRSRPENVEAERWGGGLRAQIDLAAPLLALELEGLYSSENDAFASGNVYREADYRGRAGLLFRFLNLGPLHFGARGGAQYDILSQEYEITSSKTTQSDDQKFLTHYLGGEVTLLPVSGFGVQLGATFYYDKAQTKWMPQYFLGIVFK